ncbi:MAG: XdhC family protein [Rhodothermales bacterium]|nr:XdhC family protein [Rhodothermales bacterium]
MRDIASTLREWVAAERQFAIARVMSTWGSAPRRVGSAMAISSDLRVVGSVSGGCIEGEVIEAVPGVLASGHQRVLEFGIADETAWSVGLSCGGRVRVLLEPFAHSSNDPEAVQTDDAVVSALCDSRPVVWLTTVQSGPSHHLLIDPAGQHTGEPKYFPQAAIDRAVTSYHSRSSGPVEIGDRHIFIHVLPPRSTLLIVGATDIAIHLVRLASALDFETVVIDPREVFASVERFNPAPDQLIARWPQQALPNAHLDDETYAVLLTHDPKIDDPALHHFLNSEIPYIGALGSKRTHAKRLERLGAAGFTTGQTDRIHGPVGLDIGAASPAEIALSVIAQIVHARNRKLAV